MAYGVVANVLSDRALRTGGKVWILMTNGGAENVYVHGSSKSGRVISKYIPLKRLRNFRSAWIPSHIATMTSLAFVQRDEASAIASRWSDMWENIRSYSRDGTMVIIEGWPLSTAFGGA